LVLAAAPLALVARATAPVPQPAAPVLPDTEVLTKLDSPWNMAFLPNGTMFLTEKCLGLSVRQPNGTMVKLLGMKDSKRYASTAGDLFCEGQAGMNGVAVDPSFVSDRFICVYSTSSLTAPGDQRRTAPEGQRSRHRGIRPRRHRHRHPVHVARKQPSGRRA
jgi:glucose/arabinose dehydrogenase